MPSTNKNNKTDKPAPLENLNREDEWLIEDAKAAFLSHRNHFGMWILYSIVFFILIFFLWAILFSVEEVTVGEGKVIPASKLKIIQSRDGGTVAEILVSEGDMVKKDQILLKLDETRDKADHEEKHEAYLALLAKVARLKAEAYQQSQVTFPAILREKKPELIKMETHLFDKRRSSLKKELMVMEHQAELITNILKMYEPLLDKGYASKVEYLSAQKQLDQIRIDMLQKENTFHEQVWKEFNQYNAELNAAKERLKILRDKMLDTIIYSPTDGIVNKININTVGGTVMPGMNIMEIFPLNDNLLIEVKIKPKDIAFIHPGQTAYVKISAYDYTIYGGLTGTVSYISTDSIEQKNPNNSTEELYIIHVKTTRNYLGNSKHKLVILPGMLAMVQINTGEKSIFRYLLKPLIKAKEEALRER
jgi:membrane fusion protein, adhesin transport system